MSYMIKHGIYGEKFEIESNGRIVDFNDIETSLRSFAQDMYELGAYDEAYTLIHAIVRMNAEVPTVLKIKE